MENIYKGDAYRVKETKISGIGICIALAIPSWFLGKLFPVIGAPVIAILLGIILHMISPKVMDFQEGIRFVSKKVLQWAVILLGFGMNLNQVMKVGSTSLPIIVSTVSASLFLSFILYRTLKLDSNTATLIGVGSAICGGSAIAATAPIINADDEEIAQAISVIFLFNILAALIFPSLGDILDLSNEGFGLFAGTAVNDTSSVTAVASAWDGLHPKANTLEIATIVKLTRTLAIIPITLCLSFYRMKQEKQNIQGGNFDFKKIFPFFILFFLGASLITTIGSILGIGSEIFHPLKQLSKFFIVMAMVAIGINTDLIKIIKKGGKAILLGASCWIIITLVSLVLQKFLGIW